MESKGTLPSQRAKQAVRASDTRQLTLLVRAYCHLCDEMRDALAPLAAAQGVAVRFVDVDADAALEARYGDRVPVLFAGDPDDANEICRYRFDRSRVAEALGAHRG